MERWIPSGATGWAIGVLLVSVASLSLGNVLLKVGMDRWGSSGVGPAGAGIALAGGVLLLTVQFLGMLVLFRVGWPVSVVVPLMGLNHATTALLGRLCLDEAVGPWRWTGIVLVVLGILFISAPWLSRKVP